MLIICIYIHCLSSSNTRTFFRMCLFRMMDRAAPNRRGEETNVGYPAVSRVIECMTKLGEGQFWANNSVKSFVSSCMMTNIEPSSLVRVPSSLLHGLWSTRCFGLFRSQLVILKTRARKRGTRTRKEGRRERKENACGNPCEKSGTGIFESCPV